LEVNKAVKKGMYAIAIIGVIGFAAVHFIAPYAIMQPQRTNENITPTELGLKSQRIEIQTVDNLKLTGYWIKSATDSAKGLIILVHGIGGNKEAFLGLSKELAEKGIESIVFDARAHGESEGEYVTYGYKEKEDISKIVDLVKASNPALKVGIWGNSLGGAVALQSLAVDKRIEFGISESTFTELDKIVYDYQKKLAKGVGAKFITDYSLSRAGQLADFDPEQVKPIESVKHIEQPMLIVHGDADENISVAYGRQLFENLKSTDKELIIIENGGHNGLMATGGDAFKAKLFGFIDRNLGYSTTK
jgi:alpha-beta hydrolase superfamily lysophospholipase